MRLLSISTYFLATAIASQHIAQRAEIGSAPDSTRKYLSFTPLHSSPPQNPESITNTPQASPPINWAVTLFPSFDSIDVFGPLDPLGYLAFSRKLNLALISETLEPVYVQPAFPALNKQNSSFWYSVCLSLFSLPPSLRCACRCRCLC
jgi:hypothetical protein